MGKKASEARRKTRRRMRPTLTAEERRFLKENAGYEGVAYHKWSPGDFGLEPPAAPRPDKTLCDEAGVKDRERAKELLAQAIDARTRERRHRSAKLSQASLGRDR